VKLSDVMSASGLAIYAEVGLVLFLLAFLGVVVRLFLTGKDEDYDQAAFMPLREEPVQPRLQRRLIGEEQKQ
jgi:cbb3-type cytochrome oxidase subunit 3